MTRPNIIGTYQNGNTIVQLYVDGTKIRTTPDNEFHPEFPDSLDIKITDKCDLGCPFCYAGSTPEGEHATLFEDGKPAQEWMCHLNPFTEVALNVNDLSHPQLEDLLVYLLKRKVVANITINQKHFVQPQNFAKLQGWYRRGLFWGIGVSLTDANDEDFFEKLKYFQDVAVIHVVNGIVTRQQLMRMFNRGIRLLILGYKHRGRGVQYSRFREEYIIHYMRELEEMLLPMTKLNLFKVISFDNLALEQLNVKEILFHDREPGDWDAFFSGADGSHTFYIDAVNETFARDSTVSDPEKIYSSEDLTILEMFKIIQKENGRNQ